MDYPMIHYYVYNPENDCVLYVGYDVVTQGAIDAYVQYRNLTEISSEGSINYELSDRLDGSQGHGPF